MTPRDGGGVVRGRTRSVSNPGALGVSPTPQTKKRREWNWFIVISNTILVSVQREECAACDWSAEFEFHPVGSPKCSRRSHPVTPSTSTVMRPFSKRLDFTIDTTSIQINQGPNAPKKSFWTPYRLPFVLTSFISYFYFLILETRTVFFLPKTKIWEPNINWNGGRTLSERDMLLFSDIWNLQHCTYNI